MTACYRKFESIGKRTIVFDNTMDHEWMEDSTRRAAVANFLGTLHPAQVYGMTEVAGNNTWKTHSITTVYYQKEDKEWQLYEDFKKKLGK